MKSCARYYFERKESAPTRYVLKQHEGEDIPDFPARYKSGEGYIEFQRNTQGARYYEWGFYLGSQGGKHRRLTGVNFSESERHRTFGDSLSIGRNDALLFEFSEDMASLTLWFVAGMARRSGSVFGAWCRGELSP